MRLEAGRVKRAGRFAGEGDLGKMFFTGSAAVAVRLNIVVRGAPSLRAGGRVQSSPELQLEPKKPSTPLRAKARD